MRKRQVDTKKLATTRGIARYDIPTMSGQYTHQEKGAIRMN